MNIQQVVKSLGSTFYAILTAAKELNLTGRVVNGTRVWSPAEVAAIKTAVSK